MNEKSIREKKIIRLFNIKCSHAEIISLINISMSYQHLTVGSWEFGWQMKEKGDKSVSKRVCVYVCSFRIKSPACQ